jgi:hypothetical protein
MNTIGIVLAIGTGSAIVYLIRRKWTDAVLAVVAAGALAGLLAGLTRPADPAAAVRLEGDGLRAAQWHDLPARPLQWTPPSDAVLRLEFPRRLALGRMFELTVRRTVAGSARLQLLAENNQVLAEASGNGAALTVQWLPPVAETLVLKARLLDAAGKLVAEGPVPLTVRASEPLQVSGRFGAPSFDARILNDLLAGSNALLDWQVTLGKTVTRSETARAAMAQPNLIVIDAAWFERLHDTARSALLEQVAGGTPLIVLGANASDTGIWMRTVQLKLEAEAENQTAGAPLAMAVAPFNPAPGGVWTGSEMVWSRAWQKGRIVWLGVSEWHRYAISDPRALGLWWQGVLDKAGVTRTEDVVWLEPDEMPIAGERLELCAQGVRGDAVFPGLKQAIPWQRRPDRADASCVAVWPQKAGWLDGAEVYVFAGNDWPLWQKAQRRDATARYAARTPAPVAAATTPLPAWPFALVFAAAMLGLWRRERR